MSEQKQSFMQQLDAWTTEAVIHPLIYGDPPGAPGARTEEELIDAVKSTIRQKVLESYRNGQAAPAGVKSQPSNFRPRRQTSK